MLSVEVKIWPLSGILIQWHFYILSPNGIWCGWSVPSFHGQWPFSASTLPVIGVLTGSVCGHSGRDDFTTQARLIYVGKALRAPTESVERIRRPSAKPVMANQQLRPPTDRCWDQLQRSVRVDGIDSLPCCYIIVWSLYYPGFAGRFV